MRPLTKKYIIFFIIAYLIIRLPDITGPKLSSFVINKILAQAKKNNVNVSVHDYEFESTYAINAKRVLIESSKFKNKYLLDSLQIKLVKFFTPLINIKANLYEGSLNCDLSSTGIFSLIKTKRATLVCDINSIQLQSLPDSNNYNILGLLNSSFESELSNDPNNFKIKGEVKVTDGYLDLNEALCSEKKGRPLTDTLKILCMNISKFPPILNIEFFSSTNFYNNIINFDSLNLRSSYGLFQTNGTVSSQNLDFTNPKLDIKGNFTLSSISKEILDPWIPLINNGQKLSSDSGTFTASGTAPQVKFSIK